MPGWSRPTNVLFNHTAADAAVAAVAGMRWTLAAGWATEIDAAGSALADWEGRAADNFRVGHTARTRAAEGVGTALWVLQQAIEDAVDTAIIEQARRATQQQIWDAEWRAEQEAAGGPSPGFY